MSQTNGLQSLELILEDVSAEINLSINALEHYTNSTSHTRAVKALRKCLLHLNKLKGIYTLLEMPGATRLLADVISIINNLVKRKKPAKRILLEGLSTSLARLLRYTEHICHKPCDLPQLLIPQINEIRQLVNAPVLAESVFFEYDFNLLREGKTLALLTSEETAERSRHFRQMYQVGLIEVLCQTNLLGGLKMMQKSVQKLDAECPRPYSPNLWWIAQAMLEGFISQGLKLTPSRLKIFSKLDRQVRKIENKQVNLLDENKRETQRLTQEMLYLVSISDQKNNHMQYLLDHFQVPESVVTESMLRTEYEELRGPSDQDYQSIAEALLQEIESIENTIIQRNESDNPGAALENAMKQMVNLNNLLKILQVDEQIVRLSVAIDLLKKHIAEQQELTEKDSNILFIVLKSIAEAVDKSELAKNSRKAAKKEMLSAAQLKICQSTDSQIKRLMQEFTQFTQQNKKPLLLKSIANLLSEVEQGFNRLNIKQAVEITAECQNFINHHLINAPHSTTESTLNLFADVIGGLEFYLETLTFTATPSARILEFSQNSLVQLKSSCNTL